MTAVTANVSVSLDGFVCGPNDSRENPLGDGGERLHEWVYDLALDLEPGEPLLRRLWHRVGPRIRPGRRDAPVSWATTWTRG